MHLNTSRGDRGQQGEKRPRRKEPHYATRGIRKKYWPVNETYVFKTAHNEALGSRCTYTQADRGLHCQHISECIFCSGVIFTRGNKDTDWSSFVASRNNDRSNTRHDLVNHFYTMGAFSQNLISSRFNYYLFMAFICFRYKRNNISYALTLYSMCTIYNVFFKRPF